MLLSAVAAGNALLVGCGGLPNGQPPTDSTSTATASPPPTDGTTVTRSSTPSPPRSVPFGDRFERIVDLSAVGADLDGDEPIDDLLRDRALDDTMLYFPPGRYRLAEPWVVRQFENLGLVGEEAVIVPENGSRETFMGFGEVGEATGLVLAGLTFDFRAEETGGRPFEIRVDDGLIVEDVRVVGRQDVNHDMMRFDVTSETGEGVVRRLMLADGGIPDYEITGCYVGETSRGSITFEDCYIEGFPDNGLYASSATGPVNVVGGYYANNGIASVRVGGRGHIRGVHVRCDDATRGFSNMRGIRLDNGGEARIEDCEIEMLRVTDSNGAVTLSPMMAAAVIRDTRIRVDANRVAALWAKEPADSLDDDPSLDVRALQVAGAAADGPTIEIDGRDNSRIEQSRIRQTGADRDGILIQRSSDNLIRDTTIDVTGAPLTLEEAEAETSNLDIASAPTTE